MGKRMKRCNGLNEISVEKQTKQTNKKQSSAYLDKCSILTVQQKERNDLNTRIEGRQKLIKTKKRKSHQRYFLCKYYNDTNLC